MGLLSLGTPLDWFESRAHNEHIRSHGIKQLINMFHQHSRRQDSFLWGDEVEYMIVAIDDNSRTAKLAIDCDHVIDDLNDESKSLHKSLDNNVLFHPEYGRYMIEATPNRPYNGNLLSDYVYVEKNMNMRRLIANKELPQGFQVLTYTSFPRLGCTDFTTPAAKPIGPASQSLFLPDEIINRHVRFPTLTANIRKRRGRKVAINLPLYPDKNTRLVDDSIPQRDMYPGDIEAKYAAKPGHVYMDSMGFGMGASCLQVTMQAANIDEARYLYDTLAPFTAVLLAVSAAAPIFRGHLVNQDVRWNVVSGAVDDRTFLEEGKEPWESYKSTGGLEVKELHVGLLEVDEWGYYKRKEKINDKVEDKVEDFVVEEKNKEINDKDFVKVDKNEINDKVFDFAIEDNVQHIPKSRYDSIDMYLGSSHFDPSYNDVSVPINKKVYDELVSSGFDQHLARHFAHLFIRDPLVIFTERLKANDELDNDHFENIQSTNWQTLRFKPPALYSPETDLASTPGWRVEFRPLEVQLTDFENAAFSNVIALLSKAIVRFRPDLYVPISCVERNMKVAHRVDGVKEKYWFRDPKEWASSNHSLEWLEKYIKELEGVGNGKAKTADEINGAAKAGNEINGTANGISKTANGAGSGIPLLLSPNDIINGNGNGGMIHLICRLLAEELIPSFQGTHKELASYLNRIRLHLLLVSKRASGEIPTTARWLRNKVLSSPLYKNDSRVSQELNYELAKEIARVSNNEGVEELWGEYIAQEVKRDEGK